MAQKIKILMLHRGVLTQMLNETGWKRTTVWSALNGKTHSQHAQEIRDTAVSQYGAFVKPQILRK